MGCRGSAPSSFASLTKDSEGCSQGAVATAQGHGASLSATLAGLIIVSAGYSTAFLTLAGIAGLGFALYLLVMPETRGFEPAQAGTPSGPNRRPALLGV